MNDKNCQILCGGKKVATVSRTANGFDVKCTEDGKKLCKKCGCC